MTTVTIENNNLNLHVDGADKYLALKSMLTFPLAHITDAVHDPAAASTWWIGLKLPGTSIPGVMKAGTFIRKGRKVFWDVHNPENAVIITLKDEKYQKLVVEVANPAETIGSILSAIKSTT